MFIYAIMEGNQSSEIKIANNLPDELKIVKRFRPTS